MAEYLELEKVLDDKNIITVQTKEYGSIEVIPVDTITDIELTDAKPVKRGEWEKKSSVGVFRCSLCQHIFMLGADEIDEYHFCPNCGAKMTKDGDKE